LAALDGCFFDTSVLLAGIIEIAGPDSAAQRAMSAVACGELERPRTAWHCCLEFYSVATRLPRELRVEPGVAAQLVEEEIVSRFVVHSLPQRQRLPFVRTAGADAIAGGRLYDAHIAEIARLAGADLVVTENRRHFTSLLRHGIRVLSADELVVELG
jgi:predicted nucleic acid-binding protein